MLVLPWDTARLLGLHAHLLKPATSDGARPGPTLTVDDVLITPTLALRRFRLPDATSSGNAPRRGLLDNRLSWRGAAHPLRHKINHDREREDDDHGYKVLGIVLIGFDGKGSERQEPRQSGDSQVAGRRPRVPP